MENWMLAMVAFFILVIISALGVHISIAMGIMGMVSAISYLGLTAGTSLAGIAAWFNAARFSVAMIPMFVLMGTVCAAAGIGRDAYDCFYVWLGRVRGSIAIVSVFACAAFAALTGSSTATVAAIGGISVPEMKRIGYAKTLRLGTICAAGTLGIMIPPSISFIFYGILTEVSIGKLFIAGIIPGIITAILFSTAIYVMVSLNPQLAPISKASFSLKEKVTSSLRIIPIFLVFLTVTVTIYRGVCSPEEAAAFGAFATIIVALVMRRLTWSKFKLATKDSLRISGFIMLIIMAAMLFANTIALSGFSDKLTKTVTGLDVPPYVVMIVIVLIYLGLGCVLDTFGMMVITVPVFFPVVTSIGYDPVWFGVIVTVMVECALITPPIGTNIYVTKSLDSDATSWDVIKGMVPFLGMEMVLIALLIKFPWLATWLPSKM
jgi:C4-dicarboxylate transporter DctM subunit